MKIIAIERNAGAGPGMFASLLASESVPAPQSVRSSAIADSAVVRQGMPMFVPDFAMDWKLRVVPCITIGRLGKSILPRFASRYIDSVGLGIRLMPPVCDGSGPMSATMHAGLAATFDGAFAPGTPFQASVATEPMLVDVCQHGAAQSNLRLDIRPDQLMAEETVSFVSRYVTLRTGDIIIPCTFPTELPATVNSVVELTLNGEPALRLKIK